MGAMSCGLSVTRSRKVLMSMTWPRHGRSSGWIQSAPLLLDETRSVTTTVGTFPRSIGWKPQSSRSRNPFEQRAHASAVFR